MAARNNLNCYVCDRALPRQQMARFDGAEHEHRREIAITRRDAEGRIPLPVTDLTRLCLNCNRSILDEIAILEENPDCLRLNILRQTRNATCLFCNADANLHRLTVECRVDVFVQRNIFIPDLVKSCRHHLDNRGFILPQLMIGLQFVNRPYLVAGSQIRLFLDGLRTAVINKNVFEHENNFDDDDFKCISPITKPQFQDLLTFCGPVNVWGHPRNVTRKDLLTFLCKLRQGLSDNFLKVIFSYDSEQSVNLAITKVRRSLMERFVPLNIGFNAITRENYIGQHVTDFANLLYNPEPNNRKAIACIDGTYLRVEKSTNFRAQRQSYSTQKGYNLLKPDLIVAPNGYILDIQGPYFSDAQNNDARILQNEFELNVRGMREWFRDGDIVIVDRGYRDARPLLEGLGITCKMPSLLPQGQRQLSTHEANQSRLVTKTRWVVEARNGHLKSVFKFFQNTIRIPHVPNLGEFLRIAGAIINKYHPLIYMEEADENLARELLQRATRPNVIQQRVDDENLRGRGGQWVRLSHEHILDFPVLDFNYLRDLTVGTYQIKLAPSYVQDKLQRGDQEEFQIDVRFNDPTLIRVRVYSRYRNATKHQLWISYIQNNANEDDAENVGEPITGYYCTCQAGARTLGTCSHVCSVLFYLGYARHHLVKYPSTSLLESVQDAANRPPQRNLNE